MNENLLNEFLNYFDNLIGQNNESEYVYDAEGCYLRDEYINDLIIETRELIKYGELEIALENMLDNLSEVSIFIDEEMANLAKQAFGKKISAKREKIINSLVKK